ncbi:MAG: hypothetical protein A2W28_06565, partial [Gammaproteobacteria bacterium RBG_16_51_14]
MKSPLPKWQHATLSLCLLAVVVTGLYFTLLQPALTARKNYQERIDDLSLQLDRYRNTESEILKLQDEIEQLMLVDPDNDGFLEEKSPALVAADLQRQLKSLIESNGGDLVSTNVITDPENELFPKVTIKVHMQAEMQTMVTVFYKLAVNKPFLFTSDILIQQRHMVSRRQQPDAGKLEVRFDVT